MRPKQGEPHHLLQRSPPCLVPCRRRHPCMRGHRVFLSITTAVCRDSDSAYSPAGSNAALYTSPSESRSQRMPFQLYFVQPRPSLAGTQTLPGALTRTRLACRAVACQPEATSLRR
ncbi:uncharacterized protein LOC133886228 [Phragmites australis]|uniref:uncharacterized protein LOC133886228 n=1 Tax=Phragmites australis TaxID=29695 RepID=UPI002D77B2F6|nr:uncharacterized protein LOC133886228 [Phragmites australis]